MWRAFCVLLLVVLGFASLDVNIGYAMSVVLVVLWLAVLARGRARDGRWSELCAVLDIPNGLLLIIVSVLR